LRCLVTGGAGFIGSSLVDKLIKMGFEVIVIDNESANENEKFYWNEKAENYKYDICNYHKIRKLFAEVQWVFHLAAQSRIQPSLINPSYTIEVNCHGTENVLHACVENKVNKIIYSSSSSVYGMTNTIPHKENMPLDCLNPYAISKSTGEKLCKMYADIYKLEIVILRYFNVYGERQPTKGEFAPVIGRFLKQKKINNKLTIVGKGKQKRDYTYIGDVIKANILAAKDNNIVSGEIINIGSGKNFSVIEIAEMLKSPYCFVPERKGESLETLADISKAKKLLNWRPETKLEKWLIENI